MRYCTDKSFIKNLHFVIDFIDLNFINNFSLEVLLLVQQFNLEVKLTPCYIWLVCTVNYRLGFNHELKVLNNHDNWAQDFNDAVYIKNTARLTLQIAKYLKYNVF